jgi:hypothetical protein
MKGVDSAGKMLRPSLAEIGRTSRATFLTLSESLLTMSRRGVSTYTFTGLENACTEAEHGHARAAFCGCSNILLVRSEGNPCAEIPCCPSLAVKDSPGRTYSPLNFVDILPDFDQIKLA